MSDNFIPIVSNSPPPFEDFGDEEDDFTDFASANNNAWEVSDEEEFGDFGVTNWSKFPEKTDFVNNKNTDRVKPKISDNFVVDLKSTVTQPQVLDNNLFLTNNGVAHNENEEISTEPFNALENNDIEITSNRAINDAEHSVKEDNEVNNLKTQNYKVENDFDSHVNLSNNLSSSTISYTNNINSQSSQSYDQEQHFSEVNNLQNSAADNGPDSQYNSFEKCSNNIPSEHNTDQNVVLQCEEALQNLENKKEKEEFSTEYSDTSIDHDLPSQDEIIFENKDIDESAEPENTDNINSPKLNFQEHLEDNFDNSENNGSFQYIINNDGANIQADNLSLKSSTSENSLQSVESASTATNEKLASPKNIVEQDNGVEDFAAFNNTEEDTSFIEAVQPKLGDSDKNVLEESDQTGLENTAASEFNKLGDQTDDFDNFADFSTAQPFQDSSNENNQFDAFKDDGDFPSSTTNNFVAFDAEPQDGNDSDDFGDFGDFGSFSNAGNFQTAEEIIVEKKIPLGEKMIKDIQLSFVYKQSEETDSHEAMFDLLHHINQDELEVFKPSSVAQNTKIINRPSELWLAMEDTDNTIALNFRWNNSHHNQQLLSALGAKTQNIFFSESSKPYYVPTYFSPGLRMSDSGIMQPMSAADIMTTVSPVEKNAPTEFTDTQWSSGSENSDALDTEVQQSTKDIKGGSSAVDVTVTESKKNVLDFSGVDLSMLNYSSSPIPKEEQDKVDPELLELAMSVTPDPVIHNKKTDPLSKILASFMGSPKKKLDEDDDLSDEAKFYLKKLPDLSFMSSSILMFPIGKQTPPS